MTGFQQEAQGLHKNDFPITKRKHTSTITESIVNSKAVKYKDNNTEPDEMWVNKEYHFNNNQ